MVKVYTTSQHTVELFVDTNHLHRGWDGYFGGTAQSLTSDTLSTVCGVVNDEQVAVLDDKDILVALGEISEVNKSVEEFIALETLNNGSA